MTAHTVYTVGHSTRSAEEFVALLRESGVQQLVDIRTVPRSRRNPQFNPDALPAAHAPHGIEYRHIGALGGLRKPAEDRVVAIMCAEAVWWRCHRSLVAEALLVRGHDVQHIMGPGKLTPATLRDFAVVDGDRITYPGGEPCST